MAEYNLILGAYQNKQSKTPNGRIGLFFISKSKLEVVII